MTSTVPGFVSWPLLLLMAAVLIMRYALCNTRLIETYLNNMLAFVLGCNLLRESAIQESFASHHITGDTTTQTLAVVLGNLAFIEFLGFVTLWSDASPEETCRRHRYHRLVGLMLVPAYFVTLDRIRPNAEGVWQAHGWNIVPTLLVFSVIPGLGAFQTARLGLREWSRPNVKPRERIIAACLIAVAVVILSTGLAGMANMFLGDSRIPAGGYCTFAASLVLFALASVPVVRTLIARAGIDEISRGCRSLRELQEALSAAVPESVFESMATSTGRQKTALELHRSIVQIRDGMLFLRPYFREISPQDAAHFFRRYKVPPRQRDAAVQAMHIADAIHAKECGHSPNPAGVTIHSSCLSSLEQEAAELVRVCKWWPSAWAAIRTDSMS